MLWYVSICCKSIWHGLLIKLYPLAVLGIIPNAYHDLSRNIHVGISHLFSTKAQKSVVPVLFMVFQLVFFFFSFLFFLFGGVIGVKFQIKWLYCNVFRKGNKPLQCTYLHLELASWIKSPSWFFYGVIYDCLSTTILRCTTASYWYEFCRHLLD